MGNYIYPYKTVLNKDSNIKYLLELYPPNINPNGSVKRRALFLCTCGKAFKSTLNNVISGNKKSCGCKNKSSYKEGITDNKYYTIWVNIKNRCYSESASVYNRYGGRGIRMSEEFLNDSVKFCNYLKILPDNDRKNYSLDRVNNDGNYERGNLRFTDKSTQTINRRKFTSNTSGFTGVHFCTKTRKWKSEIGFNKKTICLGSYSCKYEALEARNSYIMENNLPHKIQINISE